LCGEVRRHKVDVVGKVLPGACDVRHFGLASEDTFRSYFAGNTSNFSGEDTERVGHSVNRVYKRGDFAFGFQHEFLLEVSVCNGGNDFGDASDLSCQVRRHKVYVIGKVFPGTCHVRHFGLASEDTFRTYFAGNTSNFSGEDTERVGHGVDGIGKRRDLAFRLENEPLFQVSVCNGGNDFGDASDLSSQVRRHKVYVVGKVLPGTGHVRHFGLASEDTFRTYFAGHTSYFSGECGERVDHLVDHVLDLQDFAFNVYCNLLSKVSVCNSGRDLGNVS